MHIGLLDNDAFRRLNADSRLTFLVAIILAGKQNQEGRLEIRGVGPMTVAEIGVYTGLSLQRQKAALDVLTRSTAFLYIDTIGTYCVARFSEKSDPSDRTAAERQRRRRSRLGHAVTDRDSHAVTQNDSHALEEEVDIDTDSLRSSAVGHRDWPQDVTALASLAKLFLNAFGNCRDADKIPKYLPAYTELLGKMRSRGVTIADAWTACVDARAALNDRPLFGASVHKALSFLPRSPRGVAPENQTAIESIRKRTA